MIDLHVTEAKPSDAEALVGIIHAAFGARPPLDPPGTALQETAQSVAEAVGQHGGLLACVDEVPAGAMLFAERDGWLVLRRVSVHPRFQHRGVATAMVGCAEDVAESRGLDGVRLIARAELPSTVEFWMRRGYVEAGRRGTEVEVVKRLPIEIVSRSPDQTRDVGRRLAGMLRAGDVVLLAGELGAGKTTLTQGIAAGLEVEGEVTSPTFVIARCHRSKGTGPALLHADAYRLGGVAELDDLDLDASVDESVTVVEWGGGLAENLAEDRLDVVISRSVGAEEESGVRRIRIVPVGRRWIDTPLRALVAPDHDDHVQHASNEHSGTAANA
ncbi:MAG TPA: tRNA (adenosine(37)-N6)-threonylcarbamoyltransferase complex ATPase subunit type 1 TsaE [Actinopolymorphaceae bacterium]|jgi:tRNA threonylcarbamoyladenosine biosynthesis protein TsaE